jgi:hypothetical protein
MGKASQSLMESYVPYRRNIHDRFSLETIIGSNAREFRPDTSGSFKNSRPEEDALHPSIDCRGYPIAVRRRPLRLSVWRKG